MQLHLNHDAAVSTSTSRVAFVWRKSRLSIDWTALVPCQKEWSNTVNIAAKTSEAKDGIVSLPRGEIPVRIFALFRRSGKTGGWRGPLPQRGQPETVGEQLIWPFPPAFGRTPPVGCS
jgi:hypothetical protein